MRTKRIRTNEDSGSFRKAIPLLLECITLLVSLVSIPFALIIPSVTILPSRAGGVVQRRTACGSWHGRWGGKRRV